MQKDDNLIPVHPTILEAFKAAESEIVEHTVRHAIEEADFPEDLQQEMQRKFSAGLLMTCEILHSIMAVGGSELLKDQMQWADMRLPHEGITPEIMRRNLLLLRESVEETLEPDHSAGIVPYLDYLIRKAQ